MAKVKHRHITHTIEEKRRPIDVKQSSNSKIRIKGFQMADNFLDFGGCFCTFIAY